MRDSFAEAASRHLKDSKLLLENTRFDNAVYLAGYVVECAFKTTLEFYIDQSRAKAYRHNLVSLQGNGMNRLRTLYPAAIPYIPASQIDGTVLNQNHPHRRYSRSGLWNRDEAEKAVERAKEIFEQSVIKLVLDGVLRGVTL